MILRIIFRTALIILTHRTLASIVANANLALLRGPFRANCRPRLLNSCWRVSYPFSNIIIAENAVVRNATGTHQDFAWYFPATSTNPLNQFFFHNSPAFPMVRGLLRKSSRYSRCSSVTIGGRFIAIPFFCGRPIISRAHRVSYN
jgi:hypothetical protein